MANNISQFYFAWVGSNEIGFNAGHMREDELIFSFRLAHEEGQFATLELEVRNPHVGLLAPGRPFWAWFSWSDGSTVYPLFFGRLVGIPSNLFADVVTLSLVAKPYDYTEQRLAVAAGLKVAPFWDPIFIDPKQRDDPDVVLEGYSAFWHVDRISHQVTISDVIAGEDGVEEFTPNDVFYDNVSMELSEAPLIVCAIDATVNWVQTDNTGVIQFQKQQLTPLSTAVADSLPQQEINLGNGIIFKRALNTSGNTATGGGNPGDIDIHWDYQNQQATHNDGDTMSVSGHYTVRALPPDFSNADTIATLHEGATSEFYRTMVIGDPYTGRGAEGSVVQKTSVNLTAIDKALGQPVATDIEIATELEQNRTEVLHVRLVAGVQPVLTEATEQDNNIKETLSMTAADVVAEGAASPSDGVYFPTARGLQSLEYLLMIARAHLLVRSRVVKVSWDCRMSRLVSMSCRKNALIEDARLPGGSVLGKVVAYQMAGSGDSGEFLGNVAIHSAVGYGGSITVADGAPDYCDADYVGNDYQHFTGRLIAATTTDLTFTPLPYVVSGIQLPISNDQVVVRYEWHDAGQAAAAQQAIASGLYATRQSERFVEESASMSGPSQGLIEYAAQLAAAQSSVTQAIQDTPAWLEIELKPVQKISTDVEYDADAGALIIPQQINLYAGSTP